MVSRSDRPKTGRQVRADAGSSSRQRPRKGAARMERAAGRQAASEGRIPRSRSAGPSSFVDLRHRGEQAARIGMAGTIEEVVDRAARRCGRHT